MDYRQTPAILVADAPGLDFLNSIATPVDEAVDWISDGEGLLAWLDQAALVPRTVLEAMRSQSSAAELDALAARARELREWFRGFVQKRKGRPLAAKDLREIEPLNQLLAQDYQHGEIVMNASNGATRFELRANRRWQSPESLLMPIAEALARLVCEEDFTYVKACEGPRCTLMFADHTRGHARRWCSMAMCGNRAKVAAHRKRLREQGSAQV
ncbi:CGNR zinc finger domain-containing protein [Paraburkholderia fungorum]|jgi:predicted RNA-binding Zn ribbon-like protein|uniref:CGNR zinc finger domain-containing protein n=1 Tax=Paraburkholderia fungorum TaxID=134537 RepID=A0AAP5QG68_9BURK|nr:ABATE domain-containing protein [Paraburkholderia fungorum]MDT8842901.1 CGNR zinc finger domain-containing protein [Paraburkholderia fungorum]PRZ46095.1 putative RNA-binding Zn ribbon-like protein [Paraburkholderia fungorum]